VSNKDIFVKNRNFHQKSKFSSKIEIFVKNRNFRQKSKFSSKIENFRRRKSPKFLPVYFRQKFKYFHLKKVDSRQDEIKIQKYILTKNGEKSTNCRFMIKPEYEFTKYISKKNFCVIFEIKKIIQSLFLYKKQVARHTCFRNSIFFSKNESSKNKRRQC